MGCAPSGTKNAAVAPGKTKKTTARIDSVLSTKKGEVDKSGHTMTFEKILLKFEKLRQVLADIKAIFVSYASGASGLNFEGLKGALNILHGPMEKDEILELFEFVDLDDSKVIEFKEFLVALTVGHVLNLLPKAEVGGEHEARAPSSPDVGNVLVKKGSLDNIDGLAATTEDINIVLNLIVSAYLLFDPNGKGYISRDAVQRMIDEGKGKNTNAMLSQERWGEMDWDANGLIDFAEFVHAFSSWVDLEGEDGAVELPLQAVEADAAKTTPLERRFEPYDFNGGTTVVIAGDDYAIAAGCTRMSTGYEILSRNQSKLFEMTGQTVLATAGCLSDTDTLRRMLSARLTQYEHGNNKVMSTAAAAQLLSVTLYYRRFFPYYSFCLIAGLDADGKGAVYGYDAVGSFKRDDYGAMGSGQNFIMPILDNLIGHKNRHDTKATISAEEAVAIVKDVFVTATERDIYTGDAVEIKLIRRDGITTEIFRLKTD